MMQRVALLKKCLPLKSKMREAVTRFPPLMWMISVQFLNMRCLLTCSTWRLSPPLQKPGGKWCKGNASYIGTRGRGSVRTNGSLWMKIQLRGKTLPELKIPPSTQTHTHTHTHTLYPRAKWQRLKKKKTMAFIPSSSSAFSWSLCIHPSPIQVAQ